MKPSGTPNDGRWFCPVGIVTLQRSATRERVRQRVFVAGEDRRHLIRGLQEELIAGIAQALRVVDRLAGADAQQDVVRLIVALPQVVHVVGGDEREIQLPRERNDAAIDHLLVLDALVLHLEEEVVGTEDVAEPGGGFERRPRLLHLQRAGDLALQATAETDQPFGVLGEQLLVDPRAGSRTLRCIRPTPA